MVMSAVVMDREIAIINACRQVFPATARLLCLWHVEKNVLVHAVEEFEDGDQRNEFIKAWTKVVHATSEALFEAQWNALQDQYDQLVPGLVQYVKDTWIAPWKRSIIRAYMDWVLHLGNRVTS